MIDKMIFPSSGINAGLTESAISFDPQLPLGREAFTGSIRGAEGLLIPPGAVQNADGSISFSIYAKDASTVQVEFFRKMYELEKHENGLWERVIMPEAHETGYAWITFFVDGTEIVNPSAPVCYGASHPINYVELHDPEEEFYSLKTVPHGRIQQCYYFSSAMGLWKSCIVYTPSEYDSCPDKEYPVLYLQHGLGEDETCWTHQGKANFILDNLTADGQAVPCIIVMNNGMVQKNSEGRRVWNGNDLEELLLKDCIPYIESQFRVRKDKWGRAIAGLSMGSKQAAVISLSHPDLFGYVGIFSGFVFGFDMIRNERFTGLVNDPDRFRESFRVFFRGYGENDGLAMPVMKADSEILEKHGLGEQDWDAHTVRIYPGDHEWNVWRKCLRDFLKLIFR